jgi:serine/threonine-protein kinase RsbW
MSRNQRLEIAADLDNLKLVRDFIEQTTQLAELSHKGTCELVLAVDEAVTNVIVHGCQGDDCAIELEVQTEPDICVIRIRDNGRLFDPTTMHDPNLHIPPLERDVPGGFGVYLFKHLVDQTSYRTTSDGRNELTLLKRID